ncbi:MAG: carboxylating nicotinate-nucleotide diphosphorylase [Chthoniobacterales bacterium]|nr:carboxylating nicotinate-nucleotide diphosphorylase [Chthoniobacterales bacterium]
MHQPSPDPIASALAEDVGSGDVTSEFFVAPNLQAVGRIVARERAVVAGSETAAEVFRRVDPKLDIAVLKKDGAALMGGETILEVRGSARSILTAERVALNFLQRLSGIATLTREFVEAAGKSKAKILDTRKTTPGLRALEKAAVAAGGGKNHRFGLYDMVLVKDNHLMANDGISALAAAIERVRRERPDVRIEVEADRLEQVRSFLGITGIDVILLDNMKPTEMREAVALGKKKNGVQFEASGGVTLQNIRQVAASGVDFVSVGALTHSARAIDLSLELTHVAA